MIVKRTSMITGVTRERELDVTEEQIEHYLSSNVLLQDAFPHLNAGDREFIKTGITNEEWDEIFVGTYHRGCE